MASAVACSLFVTTVAIVASGGVPAAVAAIPGSVPAVSASPVTSYVQRVYQDLLGRAPEPGGLSYWSTALSAGAPRSGVAAALVASDEYRGDVIAGMYRQFLGRAPDGGGLAYWVGRVDAGMTFEQFQCMLLGSDEYYTRPVKGAGDPTHFVDAMYPDVLSRPVDSDGDAFFVTQLATGTPRAQVVGELVYSNEHLSTTVNGYYRHFLGRSADGTGLAYWARQLQAGQRDETIVALIIGSDEYYDAAPLRGPSPGPVPNPPTTTIPATTTTTSAPAGPAIVLASTFVSGSNDTLSIATTGSVLDVTVEEPVGRKLTESAPGPNGLAVLEVTGLTPGPHTLSVRGWTVAAGAAGGTASPALNVPVTIAAPVRATVDQADDLAGDQVHVMYVVPSDGTDRQLDVNGAITNSIAAWSGWLTGQTGGSRFRVDTVHGVPDVTFVRLGQTDAQVAASGDDRGQVESDLHAMGFNQPGKIYAVYYDGTGNFCGGGAYPPALVGNVAALYLQGSDPRVTPAARCGANPVGADASNPGYFDYGMVHEIVHTLGFVPACAPHVSVQAHVGDSPRDLMYSPKDASGAPWQFPAVLDFGHDDYYRRPNPGCLDLARSAFLDPLPAGAQSPPGWTSATANALSVPPAVVVRSGWSAPLPARGK